MPLLATVLFGRNARPENGSLGGLSDGRGVVSCSVVLVQAAAEEEEGLVRCTWRHFSPQIDGSARDRQGERCAALGAARSVWSDILRQKGRRGYRGVSRRRSRFWQAGLSRAVGRRQPQR